MDLKAKPRVLILGANFAGLGCAQKIRDYCGEHVDIQIIDRKNYLLYVPNIPMSVIENTNPELSLRMDLPAILAEDSIQFIQAEVREIDVESRRVKFCPTERPGAAIDYREYDYLVIALGARLAYDNIAGFSEYGDTVSDFYYANKLRSKLHQGGYRGGPIVIGSALFNQGDGAIGLEPYPGGSIPMALAACEGPPVEMALSMGAWLKKHGLGDASKITLTTPAEVIAEDAGEKVVNQLLATASQMGFKYLNNTQDIIQISQDGIEFQNGQSVEAEIKIIFPDWQAHDFLHDLPIVDKQGFVVTDLYMRNPRYPEIFSAGDAAAVTVPKLGSIGHQEADIVAKQIAYEMGLLDASKVELTHLQPEVYCVGDMGDNKGFYIRSNVWYGGTYQILTVGHIPYLLKQQYKNIFFRTHGKVPGWSNLAAHVLAERFAA